jgi:hypothetical protein
MPFRQVKESATNAAPYPTTAQPLLTKHRQPLATCTKWEAMQVRCAAVSVSNARQEAPVLTNATRTRQQKQRRKASGVRAQ